MKDRLGHGSNAGEHSSGIQKSVPRLTRAHFEHIAEQLLATKPSDPNDAKGAAAFSARLTAAADQLAGTNPGFNRNRFIAAASGNVKGQGLKSRASSRANAATRAQNFGKKRGLF